MKTTIRYISYCVVASLAVFWGESCANMASPTGGAYDEQPPRLLKSNPQNSALNITRRTLEIEFNENIKIEKPTEKIIITPPQKTPPVIKAVGRKAIVEFEDEMLPNTSYTIDFTDAIVDNNEGNPLENFSISFSTGDYLDTMLVSGKLLAAENLEPMPGIYVGLHTNLDDTAFTHISFPRIGRSDSRGSFSVKGLAAGQYRVYALDDKNRDYKYDNPQEIVAFLDSIVIPSSIPAVRQDTIFKDSVTIDTIKTINYTKFLPDDLLLRTFSSDFQRKYIQKHERPAREKLIVYFASPTEKPTVEVLKPVVDTETMFLTERNLKNDTITYWIRDSLVFKQDSIRLVMHYLKTDTLNKDYWEIDTLSFNFKEPRRQRKDDNKENEEIKFLNIRHNINANHEIYAPIRLEFDQPVIDFDSAKIHLLQQTDSVFKEVAFTMLRDSLNPRKFELRHKWEPGGKYRFAIDSAQVHGIYGIWNNKTEQSFTIKSLDQYGNLLFQLSGLPADKTAYVELLGKDDKPFRKVRVKNNQALIFDINPGTIYARLFIDDNDDGIWTTGDYTKKRQPEMVYYYPRSYDIRAYTDHEESWNILELPLDKQKPLEITKNKPEERKKKNLNREREQQQNQQRSSPFSGGSGSNNFDR